MRSPRAGQQSRAPATWSTTALPFLFTNRSLLPSSIQETLRWKLNLQRRVSFPCVGSGDLVAAIVLCRAHAGHEMDVFESGDVYDGIR
jgi:hypothetical protein